jgi:hypothetical protein
MIDIFPFEIVEFILLQFTDGLSEVICEPSNLDIKLCKILGDRS